MNGVEVMTSESQERMLAIVTPANLDAVLDLCRRWEIRASVIGRVTDTARFRVYDGLFDAVGVPGGNPPVPRGDAPPARSSDVQPVADVPVASLGDGPVYDRPATAPPDRAALHADDPASVLAPRFPSGTDLSGELLAVLASPNIADKSWVYRQYDHQLFLNTVVAPGGDASVLRLKGTSPRPRAHHRRPGAVLRARSLHRRPPHRDRGRSQPRLRRRGTEGVGELPELRQPRAPGGDVAVRRGGRRHERRVPGARPYRSSAATSASTTSRAAATSIPPR